MICKTSFGGRCGHHRTPPEGEKVPSSLLRSRARPQNRSTAFLQWIMAACALPHYKYGVNMAVDRGTVNMQSIGLAAISVAPSGDLESENRCFQKASQLRSFFLSAFCPPSRWSRGPLKMQCIELSTIFVAPFGFQNFGETDPRKLVGVFGALIEVVTGHCKHAVNRAGGH